MPRATLGRYMREVVTGGTGRAARPPSPVAGKTGTAELADAPSHAWFIGFAPYGGAARKIAFSVLVENGVYGGASAAPAASEIVNLAVKLGLIQPMSLFSEIEKTIERGFHRFTERMFGPARLTNLLLAPSRHSGRVESKVQIVARGRRVFPFAHVMVTLVAAEAERRTILQAAFGERLWSDIREALEGSEHRIAARICVDVRTAEAGIGDFEIAYGAAREGGGCGRGGAACRAARCGERQSGTRRVPVG